MNLLIIGTTDILGGAAKVSWDIKSALEKRGDKVTMFVADKRSDDPTVKVIPRSTWRKYLGFLFATEKLINTDWIIDTKEFKDADIVHCHNLHGRYFNLGTLQKMSQVKPVVWTLHDEWALTPHCAYTLEGKEMKNGLYICPSKDTQPRILWDNTKNISNWKNNIYAKSKLHIVTPSLWLLQRAQNTILAKQDLQLISNGVDTSIFKKISKTDSRKKLGLPLDKKIVLFLANDPKNNTWKGWKYTQNVIENYRNDENILFLSVGNSENLQDEKNVKYVKHVNNKEELALYYNSANVLLFTSIAENFPLVILEAMACGLPIVSFDVGGVKEVVTPSENGYIAKYLDSNDLISGIKWLFSQNDVNIDAISERSAQKIRDGYDISNMIDKYISLYSKLYGKN